MVKNKDYWTEHPGTNSQVGKIRPENDYYHPSMPTKEIGKYFGTTWYEITEDCEVVWRRGIFMDGKWIREAVHYPKGMVVHKRKIKPLKRIVNFAWLKKKDK